MPNIAHPHPPGIYRATVRGVPDQYVSIDDGQPMRAHTLRPVQDTRFHGAAELSDVRHMVVIDPEDRGAIHSLVQECEFYRPGETITPLVDALQRGLMLAAKEPVRYEQHHGSAYVLGLCDADADGPSTACLHLGEGDTAWNPASTKHVFHGPCTVTYTRHVDGGVSVSLHMQTEGS